MGFWSTINGGTISSLVAGSVGALIGSIGNSFTNTTDEHENLSNLTYDLFRMLGMHCKIDSTITKKEIAENYKRYIREDSCT